MSEQRVPQWQDASSYTREEVERGKVAPRSYRLRLGPVAIYVTSDHIYYRGKWVLVCPQLGLGTTEGPHRLEATTAAAAQSEALDLAAAQARQLVAALDLIRQERES